MSTGPEDAQQADTDRVLTVPNVISLIRLLLVPVVGYLILTGEYVPAFVVLVVAGVSDWLDGVIARRFHQTSKLGKLLDPMADRLFIFVTLVGLCVQGVVPWWLLIATATKDLLVTACLPFMFRRGYPGFPVHVAGKSGTFALMYAFPLLLLAQVPGVVGEVAFVLGWASAIWGVFLYWCAGAIYLHQFWQVMTGAVDRGSVPPNPSVAA
ncbi:CDP-alcohol phosphatidyltransferase family protein [Occultella glacieicola]|uniref:CDP-alcohol phosphatidyltransferase family protein n=1 Tax=Occultella glacieicola TaxID=2518684 RepID=A0ABY2E6Q3_9MICO|nr:CDP-alcohol phosphatidyltransferase family protein [Occultella glacieicola]TDE92567.1 CDP-alcohol phosphatidyltransferase family protein [Occultella glacieicola]